MLVILIIIYLPIHNISRCLVVFKFIDMSNITKDNTKDRFLEFSSDLLSTKALFVLQKQRLKSYFDNDSTGHPYSYQEFQEFLETSAKMTIHIDILLNNYAKLHNKLKLENLDKQTQTTGTSNEENITGKQASMDVVTHQPPFQKTANGSEKNKTSDVIKIINPKNDTKHDDDMEMFLNWDRMDSNFYQEMMLYVMCEYQKNYEKFEMYMDTQEYINDRMYDHLMDSFNITKKSIDVIMNNKNNVK